MPFYEILADLHKIQYEATAPKASGANSIASSFFAMFATEKNDDIIDTQTLSKNISDFLLSLYPSESQMRQILENKNQEYLAALQKESAGVAFAKGRLVPRQANVGRWRIAAIRARANAQKNGKSPAQQDELALQAWLMEVRSDINKDWHDNLLFRLLNKDKIQKQDENAPKYIDLQYADIEGKSKKLTEIFEEEYIKDYETSNPAMVEGELHRLEEDTKSLAEIQQMTRDFASQSVQPENLDVTIRLFEAIQGILEHNLNPPKPKDKEEDEKEAKKDKRHPVAEALLPTIASLRKDNIKKLQHASEVLAAGLRNKIKMLDSLEKILKNISNYNPNESQRFYLGYKDAGAVTAAKTRYMVKQPRRGLSL